MIIFLRRWHINICAVLSSALRISVLSGQRLSFWKKSIKTCKIINVLNISSSKANENFVPQRFCREHRTNRQTRRHSRSWVPKTVTCQVLTRASTLNRTHIDKIKIFIFVALSDCQSDRRLNNAAASLWRRHVPTKYLAFYSLHELFRCTCTVKKKENVTNRQVSAFVSIRRDCWDCCCNTTMLLMTLSSAWEPAPLLRHRWHRNVGVYSYAEPRRNSHRCWRLPSC